MASAARAPLAIRLGKWAADRAERPWLPPILMAFPAADFLLPVMPNQLLLAGLSMIAPKRWPIFALFFALGTSLGAMAVAYALQSMGISAELFLQESETTGALEEAFGQFRIYGLWFLVGMALLPWTPRLTVVACALAGFAPLAIFATLLAARLVPCSFLGLAGAHAPKLALRSRRMRNWVERFRGATGRS